MRACVYTRARVRVGGCACGCAGVLEECRLKSTSTRTALPRPPFPEVGWNSLCLKLFETVVRDDSHGGRSEKTRLPPPALHPNTPQPRLSRVFYPRPFTSIRSGARAQANARTHARTHTHTPRDRPRPRARARLALPARTRAREKRRTHTRTRAHTNTRTRTRHARAHTHTHSSIHMCEHTDLGMSVCTHARTQICTRARTHTHTHRGALMEWKMERRKGWGKGSEGRDRAK